MNNFSIVEAMTQIAREKNVGRELVVETLAEALVSAAKKRYGNTENFQAEIDPVTGQMDVFAHKTVVEEIEEPSAEIELEEARAIDAQAQMGSVVVEKLDLADFGRNAIQTAKQILIQRVREAERERIYEEFGGRTGQIESGIVQQISRGDIILNLGRAEAAIPLKEQIRRERYRQGDTVRGYIYEVLLSSRGPQVLLSRTRPELLKKLFGIEVPEIAEGIVEIHAVAREPGERAKIAVSSHDERVDPVGACVGVKGARVQAIVRELGGERIDIVPWSDEPEVFIGRALSPATVSRVILDHRRHHASAIVVEDQLSLAIGRSGQNSRLAVQLTEWGLDIITEDEYQERRSQVEQREREFRQLPGVSELIALSLATSGFTSIADIAQASADLLQTVPGLEGEEATASLKQTAETYLVEHPEPAAGADSEEEVAEEGSEPDVEPDVEAEVETVADAEPEPAAAPVPELAAEGAADVEAQVPSAPEEAATTDEPAVEGAADEQPEVPGAPLAEGPDEQDEADGRGSDETEVVAPAGAEVALETDAAEPDDPAESEGPGQEPPGAAAEEGPGSGSDRDGEAPDQA